MLRKLPHAVIWLPTYPPLARKNLADAARAAGIDTGRIVYLPNGTRAEALGLRRPTDSWNTFGLFDYALYRKAFDEQSIPHLYLEFEEKMWLYDRIRTEVETFVESMLFA